MTSLSALHGALVLTPGTFLMARGPDAERLLNGQLSNNIRDAAGSRLVYSTVLNTKGQLDAVCHVWKLGNAYLLNAPADLRDSLPARLDRYLIADDVKLSDESHHWTLCHVLGISPGELPETLQTTASNCFGAEGVDIVANAPLNLGVPELDPAEVEALRIAHSVPAWGHELTPGLLPPEAGLNSSAIFYDKGCYLGQEVISSMKRASKTNWHLVWLRVLAETPADTALLADGVKAGTITSVSPMPDKDGLTPALGYRGRKHKETTTFQLANHPGEAVVM